MIRQKVIDTLVALGPLTVEQLSQEIGVPRQILRTALAAAFYRQVEIDHPEHGRTTAWTPRATAIRVDAKGRYSVPGEAA